MIFEPGNVSQYDRRTRDINKFLNALWYYNPSFFMRFINTLTSESIFKWNGLLCDGCTECRAKLSSKERVKTLCFSNIHFHLFIVADKKCITDYKALYDYVNFIVNNLHNSYPRIMLFVPDKEYDATVKKIENIRKELKSDYDIYIVKWSVYVETKNTYKASIGF